MVRGGGGDALRQTLLLVLTVGSVAHAATYVISNCVVAVSIKMISWRDGRAGRHHGMDAVRYGAWQICYDTRRQDAQRRDWRAVPITDPLCRLSVTFRSSSDTKKAECYTHSHKFLLASIFNENLI